MYSIMSHYTIVRHLIRYFPVLSHLVALYSHILCNFCVSTHLSMITNLKWYSSHTRFTIRHAVPFLPFIPFFSTFIWTGVVCSCVCVSRTHSSPAEMMLFWLFLLMMMMLMFVTPSSDDNCQLQLPFASFEGYRSIHSTLSEWVCVCVCCAIVCLLD